MDSELFSAPYESDPNWNIAKSFFRELVTTTRMKVRWPGDGAGGLGLGREDREGFDSWRRDAGEVIVGAYVFFSPHLPFEESCSSPKLLHNARLPKARDADVRYYILRDEMLGDLTKLAGEQVRSNAPWQVSFHFVHDPGYSFVFILDLRFLCPSRPQYSVSYFKRHKK